MTQIAGALISIVLVLVAVFLPVAFLGGVTGKLYQQFAVTIAISMVISGIMALTLSPALAAIIIKAHHGEKKRFFRWFENGFERLRTRLRRRRGARDPGAGRSRSSPSRGIIAGVVLHVPHRCRRASCPRRTRATSSSPIIAPDTANLEVVAKLTERVQKIVSADPAVQDVASVAGYSLLDGQIAEQRRRRCSRR